MKRLLFLFLFCLFTGALAAGQTLADAAREQAKKKPHAPATHVYTNESMEFHAAPPDSSPPPARSTDAAARGEAKTKADANADEETPVDPAAEKKKAADALKEKYTKQQAELSQLQRELDVLVRENRIRAAVYYADAGSRLRDETRFAADDRKYQADIAAKQKAIVDGQANLEKLREEARRTGVPLS